MPSEDPFVAKHRKQIAVPLESILGKTESGKRLDEISNLKKQIYILVIKKSLCGSEK